MIRWANKEHYFATKREADNAAPGSQNSASIEHHQKKEQNLSVAKKILCHQLQMLSAFRLRAKVKWGQFMMTMAAFIPFPCHPTYPDSIPRFASESYSETETVSTDYTALSREPKTCSGGPAKALSIILMKARGVYISWFEAAGVSCGSCLFVVVLPVLSLVFV